MPVLPPESDSDPQDIADWLELSAMLSGSSTARIDELENIFDLESDEEDDFGKRDQLLEDLRSRIGAEFTRRLDALNGAYPFRMSANGEELEFTGANNLGTFAYLISLVLQHSWPNGYLTHPHKASGDELVAVRKPFEVLAAMAVAGYTEAPSFHIGKNRGGADKLLAHLRHAWEFIADGHVRDVKISAAPEAANDDGVDVIGYRPSNDGPPPKEIVFAQSASGNDWKAKSVRVEIDKFVANWFDVPPVSAKAPLMVVAALPAKNTALQQTQRLGYLCHRLRMPHLVRLAEIAHGERPELLDCGADIGTIRGWLNDFLEPRKLPA